MKTSNILSLNHIKNSAFLLADKGIKLFSSFIFGVLLARTINPESFAQLVLIQSVGVIFGILINFGLDSLLIKQLLEKKIPLDRIFSSIVYFKIILSFTIYSIIIIAQLIFFGSQSISLTCVVLLSLLLSSFNIYELLLQSHAMFKEILFSTFIGTVFSTILKILFFYFSGSLIYYVLILFFEQTTFILLQIFFTNKKINSSLNFKSINVNYLYQVLKLSFPLMFVALIYGLISRIDNFILTIFFDSSVVSANAVAYRMYEVNIIIPVVIMSVAYPKMILTFPNKIEFEKLTRKIIFILLVTSTMTFIFYQFFTDIILRFLFGNKFPLASELLRVQSYSIPFVYLIEFSGYWYVLNNINKLTLLKVFSGLLIGLIFNLCFVRILGPKVVSYSFLCMNLYMALFFDLFFNKTRKLLRSKLLLT